MSSFSVWSQCFVLGVYWRRTVLEDNGKISFLFNDALSTASIVNDELRPWKAGRDLP